MYRPIFPRHPLAFLSPISRTAGNCRHALQRLAARMGVTGLFPISVLAIGALAALAMVAPDARANEPASAPAPKEAKAEPKAETRTEARPAATAQKGEKAEKAEKAEPADAPPEAMDRLREKLAQRLGAVRAPGSKSPNDLQVAGKNPEAPQVPKLAAKAKPARAGADGALDPHAVALHPAGPAHWAYNGAGGPDTWASLKPEFAACGTGQRQSPIDIRDGIQVQMPAIQFDYKPSGFSVIDNGHTVQVNLPAGSGITVNNRRYDLLQFHFHRPSEERINGKPFDMVVHLVHKDPEGKLAVVAVLLERGSAQPVVQAVWNALPLEKNEDTAAPGSLDVSQLLPKDQRFYTYMGSLTTPPCSEGVLWLVMKQPVQLSPEQLNIFSRMYPMNARPIQPSGGRMIKESS